MSKDSVGKPIALPQSDADKKEYFVDQASLESDAVPEFVNAMIARFGRERTFEVAREIINRVVV